MASNDVPESQPIGFFDLPPELRNRISTLVVQHEENNNIISPVSKASGGGSNDMVCIDGQWYEGYLSRRRPLTVEKQNAKILFAVLGRPQEKQAAFPTSHKHFEYTKKRNSNDTTDEEDVLFCEYEGHVCSKTCLLEPPLARVNQQLRSESLSLFYSVNTFRFFVDSCIRKDRSLALPFKYWRSIGDTNLRNMQNFSVSATHQRTLQVINRHESAPDVRIVYRGDEFTLVDGVWSIRDPDSGSIYARHCEGRRVRKLAQWVVRGRLCVQTIEAAVDMLEGSMARRVDFQTWLESDAVDDDVIESRFEGEQGEHGYDEVDVDEHGFGNEDENEYE
ncbi:hypothetical protein LTR56_009350 [Elasticomyces elasticus]|nr:hypothetical protein LTR56_009350 [Elasticomyces elasticus]KAK3666336.1 hypothetical protein LTR22_002640 [Elasticomyces elasticus]KAK4917715.1 hypothetical protein LTR49_014392 [Elasticomyces elasticus]KAK5766276.1 hypothetical protein LTS12_003487 [Elasticomyces elasticus]